MAPEQDAIRRNIERTVDKTALRKVRNLVDNFESEERARKNLTAILKAMATVGQARVAERLGVNESTVSRMKDSELERIAALLSALDLKCVPVSMQLIEPERIEALRVLARIGLDSAATPSQMGDL